MRFLGRFLKDDNLERFATEYRVVLIVIGLLAAFGGCLIFGTTLMMAFGVAILVGALLFGFLYDK